MHDFIRKEESQFYVESRISLHDDVQSLSVGEFVKSLVMHCFINYFDYILHIIESNLRCFHIFFRLGVVLIKRRKRVIEARVLYAWAEDSPKMTKMNILSGLGFQKLEKS